MHRSRCWSCVHFEAGTCACCFACVLVCGYQRYGFPLAMGMTITHEACLRTYIFDSSQLLEMLLARWTDLVHANSAVEVSKTSRESRWRRRFLYRFLGKYAKYEISEVNRNFFSYVRRNISKRVKIRSSITAMKRDVRGLWKNKLNNNLKRGRERTI